MFTYLTFSIFAGKTNVNQSSIKMAQIGVAFSGGGIRSAAFCSGALRRLLQKNVKIDFLSCVSGGGYTGSAYVDWKYRHDKKDDKKWHQDFFNHMRQEAGLICHCQRPCKAILESMALIAVLIFVSVIVPVLLWASIAFPLASVIDFLFGSILRGTDQSCSQQIQNNPNITIKQCREEQRSPEAIFDRYVLFMTPVLVAFLSHVLTGCIPRAKKVFQFFTYFCVIFFALVFFPWFINDFLHVLSIWMKILVLVPLFFVWISFPLNRTIATLMIGIYIVSFVVFWRVYKESALGFVFDEKEFDLLLGISILLHWIGPPLVTIQQRLGHVYVRYDFQKTLLTFSIGTVEPVLEQMLEKILPFCGVIEKGEGQDCKF